MIRYQLSGRLPSVLKRTVFSRLSRACRGVPRLSKRGTWDVGVSFVTPMRIEILNRTYRGKKCPTDVLSFAADGGVWSKRLASRETAKEFGDIVICARIAAREAKRRGIDPAEELVRLLAHGTLHLAGMDHGASKEEERMFRLQEKIVEKVMS